MKMVMNNVLSIAAMVVSLVFQQCATDKSETAAEGELANGFNSVFFDVSATTIVSDSPDTVDQAVRKMESINLSGKDSFWSDHQNYFMYAMGYIDFPSEGQYFFQLTSSGKINLKINNKEIFNLRAPIDTTITGSQYVAAGKNLFEIEYFDAGLDPKMILAWSKDGSSYEVIPTEMYSHLDEGKGIRPYSRDDEADEQTDVSKLNALSDLDKKEGWKLLFDGETTKGWHRYNSPGEIGKKWKAQNGSLTFVGRDRFRFIFEGRLVELGDTHKVVDGGIDITSDEAFENFELALEWKLSEGGNSGIFYTVLEDVQFDEAWKTSPEMQVLDNLVNKDGLIVSHQAGDLYDLIQSSESVANPAGKWNKVKIVKNKGSVQHWLNDVKVVEYQIGSPQWDELFMKSKFKSLDKYASLGPGKIALQDHDTKVSFRNIKIREIKP